jgi:membrane protein required for beta-lactamase induction
MMFLSMMIALALHQLLHSPAQRPGDGWLLSWHHWLAGRVPVAGLAVALTIAVPLLLVAWLLSAVEGALFGVFSLLVTAALLLWSLGREDYHTAMEQYLAQREGGNDEGAWLGVQTLWSPDPDPGPNDVDPQAAAAQGEQRLL